MDVFCSVAACRSITKSECLIFVLKIAEKYDYIF